MKMKSIQHDYPASTGYNGFAWYYDQYWGDEYYAQAFGILEQLLLNELPSGARILDVGCGTGHLSKRLFDRGYLVTGIDISEDMLEYARLKLPQAEFQKADACDFHYPP